MAEMVVGSGRSSKACSMARSSSSSSFSPSSLKPLSPLSSGGLWLAEIMSPQVFSPSDVSRATFQATAGVGAMPSTSTLSPRPTPRMKASDRGPELHRGSQPTTSRFTPASRATLAQAVPQRVTSSAVRGERKATPRLPSVPK